MVMRKHQFHGSLLVRSRRLREMLGRVFVSDAEEQALVSFPKLLLGKAFADDFTRAPVLFAEILPFAYRGADRIRHSFEVTATEQLAGLTFHDRVPDADHVEPESRNPARGSFESDVGHALPVRKCE